MIARGDPQKTAVLIWAHLHGLVSLKLAGLLDALAGDEPFAEFLSPIRGSAIPRSSLN